MKIADLRREYHKAYSEKTFIIGKYNEVARYTMPYVEVYNKHTKAVEKHINHIDPVILQSGLELKNFIMSTLLNDGNAWATVDIDKKSFEQINITGEDYDTLNQQVKDAASITFEAMNNSNFYNSLAKAMVECENLGTSCIKILENESQANPFTIQHIRINSLYFTEDYLGRPNNVFVRYTNVAPAHIRELFNIEYNIGDQENITLIESVVYWEGKYIHRLSDEDFTEVLYEKELEYNPFIVFRWDTSLTNSYGVGVGMYLVDEFKKLELFKKLHRESAELLVHPPLMYTGTIAYMHKMSFSAGSVSYAGESREINDIRPVGLGTQLLPIEGEIAKTEAIIRDAYISNPLGYYTDKSGTSATEINARMMLFRERFAGVYESLSDELLKATFINIFKLLLTRGYFEIDEEYIELLTFKYVNSSMREIQLQEANKLLKFQAVANSYFPKSAPYVLNATKILTEIADLIGIDEELINDERQATLLQMYFADRVRNQSMVRGYADAAVGNTQTPGTT